MARSSKVNIDLYLMEFPTRLRMLLEETGISYRTLGAAIGTTYQTISSYCDGKSMPTLQYAQAIADYFDVSLDYLTGRSNVRCRNEEIQTIHDKTGLSQEAIEKLCMFDDRKIKDKVNKFAAMTTGRQFCKFYSDFILDLGITGFLWTGIVELERYKRGLLSEEEEDVFYDSDTAISFWEFELQQNILRFIKEFISELDVIIPQDLEEKDEEG